MELTAEQGAIFQRLCGEIKPGEYGRVTVSFTGQPSNTVQITGEKNYRFDNRKFHGQEADPTLGEAQNREKSGKY